MIARTKAISTKEASKAASLGLQIDAIYKLREKLREIQEREKEQLQLIAAAEEVLIATMDKEGVAKSTGKLATVSIADSVVIQTEDWDSFFAYVMKNKASHLVEKRPAQAAVRELFELGKKVPGVQPFTKRKLSIRKT